MSIFPWDSPGKNTGVGCHFLLQCRKVKSEREVVQSCLTLRDPMDCCLPGSSVHGIFQARVLEWGGIAFSIIHHQVNVNQSQNKIPTHIHQDGSNQITGSYKCWLGSREVGTLILSWWECEMIQLLRKTVWQSFKKLPYDPTIPISGI